MTKVFTFDMNKLQNKLLQNARADLEDATNELYIEIQQNSPVDTWYYLSKHYNKWVRFEDWKMIWEVENMWEYPEKVEGWWRNTPVNWHLQKWEIFYSVWAMTYQKSLQKVWERFIAKLKRW